MMEILSKFKGMGNTLSDSCQVLEAMNTDNQFSINLVGNVSNYDDFSSKASPSSHFNKQISWIMDRNASHHM